MEGRRSLRRLRGGESGGPSQRSGDGGGAVIERRLDVIPRAGKKALFSVYVLRPTAVGGSPAVDELVVRDERGERTARFRALRGDMGMPP
jgi:hypothetical protein